jgi:ubiquinone/menaquinone biosynthesis C-methylase UbiE
MVHTIEATVRSHYARSDLEQAIDDALLAAGKDPAHLTPDDLAPVDEFHTAGRQGTVEFAGQVATTPGMHLLDIGCGIGGPSRYFAVERGCHVTGIDLTDDYVRTAASLARRVGLDGKVTYRQASALALPFEAATFDGAYMMHVGMNIEDKPRLFREVRRVLKKGGWFAIFDVMRSGDGPLAYPVHWAASEDTSFVVSSSEYRRHLEGAGFAVVMERSRTDAARAAFEQAAQRIKENGGAPPPLGVHILMKGDVPVKLSNVMANLNNGLIAPTELISEAR